MKKYSCVPVLFASLLLAASCSGGPKTREANSIGAAETAPAETDAGQTTEANAPAGDETEESGVVDEAAAQATAAGTEDTAAIAETVFDKPAEPESEPPLPEPDIALAETESAPPAAEPDIVGALPEPELPPVQPETIPPPALTDEAEEAPPAEPAPVPPLPPVQREEPADGTTEPAQPARPEEPAGVTQNQPPLEEQTPAAADTDPQARRTGPDTPSAPVALTNAIDEKIVFSRIVRVTVGQLLEIPFRGTGWVYLGELGARRGIAYDSRRIDPEGQSFVFRVEAAGTYALKFYKQDFIRNFILNDYVQVIAGDAPDAAGSGWFSPPVDRGRVIAEPRWPGSLEEAEIARLGRRPAAGENTPGVTPDAPAVPPGQETGPGDPAGTNDPSAPPGSVLTQPSPPQNSPQPEAPPLPAGDSRSSPAAAAMPVIPPDGGTAAATIPEGGTPQDQSPETLLQKAREEFEAGKVLSAISALDRFRESYPAGSDEAYWLYGQFYEANSPARNILSALDYYRRLVREYPHSGRYNDARRRIAYLERFYINIQ